MGDGLAILDENRFNMIQSASWLYAPFTGYGCPTTRRNQSTVIPLTLLDSQILIVVEPMQTQTWLTDSTKTKIGVSSSDLIRMRRLLGFLIFPLWRGEIITLLNLKHIRNLRRSGSTTRKPDSQLVPSPRLRLAFWLCSQVNHFQPSSWSVCPDERCPLITWYAKVWLYWAVKLKFRRLSFNSSSLISSSTSSESSDYSSINSGAIAAEWWRHCLHRASCRTSLVRSPTEEGEKSDKKYHGRETSRKWWHLDCRGQFQRKASRARWAEPGVKVDGKSIKAKIRDLSIHDMMLDIWFCHERLGYSEQRRFLTIKDDW